MTSASEKSDFRLATLLRLREATRDERRAQLAEAHRTDEALVRHLARLETEQERVQEECREAAAPGTVNIDRLIKADRYAAWMQARKVDLCEQRNLLAAEIERRHLSLLAADQEVQIIEKLRDRRRQAQRLEDERQESKRLDEAALLAVPSSLIDTRGMPTTSGIVSSW